MTTAIRIGCTNLKCFFTEPFSYLSLIKAEMLFHTSGGRSTLRANGVATTT
jgi:hypothetical protein